MKFRISTVGLTVLVTAALILGIVPKARAAGKVIFLLDWLYGGKHAPFFVARDKGFFKKNGLDVTILKGGGSGKASTSTTLRLCITPTKGSFTVSTSYIVISARLPTMLNLRAGIS